MFTGLISAVGVVRSVAIVEGGRDLWITAPWRDLTLGESIAVDGACLTVTACDDEGFAVHVVVTSMDRTTFGSVTSGQRVNLERAMQIGDRLGGHMVQGHVDGVGEVVAVEPRKDAWLIDLRVPPQVAQVSIPLGSITVNGVSLTVNALPAKDIIQLSVIPFTLQHTTLQMLRLGSLVHVEGDMVGKYLRHFVHTANESRDS